VRNKKFRKNFALKRDNVALKRMIQELERQLVEGKQSYVH